MTNTRDLFQRNGSAIGWSVRQRPGNFTAETFAGAGHPNAIMILITGATGQIGRELIRQLIPTGAPLRAFVRQPARADLPASVERVAGDFSEPTTFVPALRGVDHVFLLQNPNPALPAEQAQWLEAARAAGVQHIVKLSALGAQPRSKARIARLHGETEQQLEASGIGWTHLRPSFFMQNTLAFATTIAREGKFYAPTGAGAMGFVDVRDIAAVAAVTLTQPGHQGRTYTLTGPAALNHAQVAEIIGATIGRPVEFVDITADQFKAGALRQGLAEWLADGLNELYALVRAGYTGLVTADVQTVTGRPPRSFAEFARDHAATFQPRAA